MAKVGVVNLGFPDESGGMVGYQAVVCIPQYYTIVKYDLKGYSDQAALPDKQQILVDDSVEALNVDIVLKFKKLLVEEGGNDIISDGPQNLMYEFSYTVGEGLGSNRSKSVINHI